MLRIPDYAAYSLIELYQVLNSIRADLYPYVFDALEKELHSRDFASVIELEECYLALNKGQYPEHAARLLTQIENHGGFSLYGPEEVTDENKYGTFWRRFWALFLDLFVVAIPLSIALFAIEKAGLLGAVSMAFANVLSEFAVVAYYIAMHARYGQTLGKMVTKVKVLDKSEQKEISLKQSMARDIVPVIFASVSLTYLVVYGDSTTLEELSEFAKTMLRATAIAPAAWGIAELLTMLFNKRRRAIHDFIAQTVVVRLP